MPWKAGLVLGGDAISGGDAINDARGTTGIEPEIFANVFHLWIVSWSHSIDFKSNSWQKSKLMFEENLKNHALLWFQRGSTSFCFQSAKHWWTQFWRSTNKYLPKRALDLPSCNCADTFQIHMNSTVIVSQIQKHQWQFRQKNEYLGPVTPYNKKIPKPLTFRVLMLNHNVTHESIRTACDISLCYQRTLRY